MLDDVRAHPIRGCRGERHERRFGKMIAQFRQPAVFGAEIVAPFAHAVRFIDGDLA